MYLIPGKYQWLDALKDKVTDFFFPWGTYCICCGNFIDETRTYCICDHCMRNISWGNISINHKDEKAEMFDSTVSCMGYGIYERSIIFNLKYNGNTYVARILAKIMMVRLMYDEEGRQMLEADYINPVPVHREKIKARGFNQTEKVGKYLSGYSKIQMLADGLERSEKTAAQRSVSGKERFDNLAGAFAPSPDLEEKIRGKHVILLDDIYTTGATAWHCGRILRDAGAARVDCLVLASGNDDGTGIFDKISNNKS